MISTCWSIIREIGLARRLKLHPIWFAPFQSRVQPLTSSKVSLSDNFSKRHFLAMRFFSQCRKIFEIFQRTLFLR